MKEAAREEYGWDGAWLGWYLPPSWQDLRSTICTAEVCFDVQAFLQSRAQPVRVDTRSRFSFPDQAAQRGVGKSLLWRSAAQGIRSADGRGRHREDSAASMLASTVRTKQRHCLRISLQLPVLSD